MNGPFRETTGPTSVAYVRQACEDFGVAARGIDVEVLAADHQNKHLAAIDADKKAQARVKAGCFG